MGADDRIASVPVAPAASWVGVAQPVAAADAHR
jgi:hypothetical protein